MKVIALILLALAAFSPALAGQAVSADPVAVALLHSGIHDCPHCRLVGADLTNTCVKAHDLQGADFDGANATLMCMSYADFRGASFRGTNLSAANLAHAKMAGADLTGAQMTITSLLGTDMSDVKGLTQKQLDAACGDAQTRLPPGLKIHMCS